MDIKKFVLSYYKNAADGMHIQRVEKKAIEATKPHTHIYFQIYYVAKGNLTHHLGDTSSHLSRGDMFIVPPGITHYIERDPETVFYSFSFMPDIFGMANDSNRLAQNFLHALENGDYKAIRPKITVPVDETLYVENIMERLLKEFTLKPLGYGEVMRSYAILLITLFARNYIQTLPDMTPGFENNRQSILHCIQYINHNFTEELSLDEVARYSAMSKSCFCKLFMEMTGHSFHQYVNSCRIRQATEYIRKGYQITGIYGLCGYNDFSTFYRNFKKIMGVSPKEYGLSMKST